MKYLLYALIAAWLLCWAHEMYLAPAEKRLPAEAEQAAMAWAHEQVPNDLFTIYPPEITP